MQAAVVMTLLLGSAAAAGTRDSFRCFYRFYYRHYYRQKRAPIRCLCTSDPLT
ncbi:hypothetical protein [Streptomyces sp. H39-C1]|uniref:hypothetical protein n=1 Tax=Streptomyces sp. H39-C1 TaxID=3004355 RepID=UPI0022AE7145|nr:hypothetical protein [Streptomyces sp. H39-C1]MCZ4103208.1 hypothetical protein [Streptomyces sp. H39-C1]